MGHNIVSMLPPGTPESTRKLHNALTGSAMNSWAKSQLYLQDRTAQSIRDGVWAYRNNRAASPQTVAGLLERYGRTPDKHHFAKTFGDTIFDVMRFLGTADRMVAMQQIESHFGPRHIPPAFTRALNRLA